MRRKASSPTNKPIPLGSRVIGGVGWSAVSAIPSMAVALAAQVALGLLLSKEDFGVYGIALGISSFAMAIRDGGVRLYLIQLNPERVLAGAVGALRLTYAWSFGMALALGLAAFPLASAFNEPRIAPVMLVLAAAMPLSAYPSVALALVQVEMRFRALAVVSFLAALMRYGGAVTFAALGLGALSLALPFVVVGVFEVAAARLASGIPLVTVFRTHSGASRRNWFALTKWSMVGSLVMQLGFQADYVALGLVATTGAVGVYFFGYQIAIQLRVLTVQAITNVLIPALAQIREDPARVERVFQRASATTLAVLGPIAAWLAVSAGDIETLLWGGKWSEAVVPIRVIAVTIPIGVALSMGEWLLQAWGRFTLWTKIALWRGVGLFCTALVAGLLFPSSAQAIALGVGGYLVVASIVLLTVSVRSVGFSALHLARVVAIPLVGSGVSALGAAVVIQANITALPPLSLLATSAASTLLTLTFYLLCWRQGLVSVTALVKRSLSSRRVD